MILLLINLTALDLLERMLDFNPQTRITAEEALCHKYLSTLHDPDTEITCSPLDFSFERLNSEEEMRAELLKELKTYEPARKPN